MKLIKENFDSSIDRERRIFDYKLKHLIESVEKEIEIKENINQDLKVSEDKAKIQLQGLVDQAKKVLGEVGDGLKADIAATGFTLDNNGKVVKAVNEDVKKLSNGKWANVGKDGKADSGEFKTKKEARQQQKAMYANGYKGESLEEDVEEVEVTVDGEPMVPETDEHSVENVPEMPETNCKMIISNLINPLIQDELQAIDGYNSAVATIRGIIEDSTHDDSIDYEGIIAVISEITNEENIHIGQLEKLLEMVSPNAESIDDGKEEAEEQLAETEEKKAEETTAENKE